MANNIVQVKRTSVSGRAPNTTSAGNSQYINAGELALNMPDGILYTSNGSALITIGANLTNQNVTGNLTVKGIIANGSLGSGGEVLASNGSAVYWTTVGGTGTVTSVASANGIAGGPITGSGTLYAVAGNSTVFVNASGIHVNTDSLSAGVNVDAQYVWTNTQSFTNTITFTQIINATANNTSFVGTVSAANVVSNAQLSANLANYQTTAGLSANVATLSANAATFLNGKTESNLNVNNALTANNSNNLGGVAAASYVQNTDSRTLSGNLVFTANVTLNGIIANGSIGTGGHVLHSDGTKVYWAADDQGVTSVASGNGLTGGTITTTGTLSVVAGNSGVISNSSGVFVNAATFSIATSQLSGDVALGTQTSGNYVATITAGNGLTGDATGEGSTPTLAVGAGNGISVSADAIAVNGGNTLTVNSSGVHVNTTLRLTTLTTSGNVVVEGNLTVSGNVTVIGANNLSIVDNFIYLNSNNTTQNIDLGFAGNYNDGTYKHAGFFRDATDGFWKVFDGYTPEPDAAVDIDTANNSFNIAGMWFSNTRIGNTTVYATINSTAYSGSANNATNLNGQAASFYTNATNITTGTLPYAQIPANIVNTTGSFTISGNTTLAGTNTTISSNLNVTGTFVNIASSNVIANSAGVFVANSIGVVNAGVHSVGTLIVANTTQFTLTLPFSANGSSGTAGQVLTSNGAVGSPYWAASVGGGYYKGGSATVGTLADGGQNIFRVNANTLNYNTTIASGENAQATGPITVASGITLTVQSGARVSIV